ncbi:MAG: nucleoside kinase [Spirochaetes bacterium]|nr:nucleoside kinase [Spirochaetota bacterium]
MINNLNITYNGKTLIVPYGSKIVDIVDEFGLDILNDNIMGAILNNRVVSLDYHLKTSGEIKFIYPNEDFGFRIYVNSLTFLLFYVWKSIFKKNNLIISHSLSDGLYFYKEDGEEINENDIERINFMFDSIVSEKLKIEIVSFDKEEAKKIFQNEYDKYNLLKYSSSTSILLAKLKDFSDFIITPIVINTGLLKYYKISKYKDGIILRYPKQKNFPEFVKFEDQKKLFFVYKDQEDWGKILKFDNVGNLNKQISDNRLLDIILISEALQENKISDIVKKILEDREKRLILIAGPSSSGKTTFSIKLMTYLKSMGINSYQISLDNYFVDREKTPRDETGDYNYEVIEALDIEVFNDNLNSIFEGKETVLPIYDFKKGKRASEGLYYKPEKDVVVIVEGIHGLNPKLTYNIDPKYQFRIYISPLTQLNLTNSIRIPTTISRLYRRLVRDFRYRGISAIETLKRWNSVRKGEDNYIFPYQNNANVYFNSSLSYELSVLKTFAEPLLKSIDQDDDYYPMAQMLLDYLIHFIPIPPDLVPNTSILREFIGGSLYLQNIH